MAAKESSLKAEVNHIFQCQLINGCEILVVTPPSLKRVLDAGYTDLQRLCHLVSLNDKGYS